jgi:hypothetical protein
MFSGKAEHVPEETVYPFKTELYYQHTHKFLLSETTFCKLATPQKMKLAISISHYPQKVGCASYFKACVSETTLCHGSGS